MSEVRFSIGAMKITIEECQANLETYIERVGNGEVFAITENGRVRAYLVPSDHPYARGHSDATF